MAVTQNMCLHIWSKSFVTVETSNKYCCRWSASAYVTSAITPANATAPPSFYICRSVCRNSRSKKSNKMQQYADIYLLLNYSTCFGRPSHPSSGVHKTVVATSGTDHTIWDGSFFKRDQIRTQSLLMICFQCEDTCFELLPSNCLLLSRQPVRKGPTIFTSALLASVAS